MVMDDMEFILFLFFLQRSVIYAIFYADLPSRSPRGPARLFFLFYLLATLYLCDFLCEPSVKIS